MWSAFGWIVQKSWLDSFHPVYPLVLFRKNLVNPVHVRQHVFTQESDFHRGISFDWFLIANLEHRGIEEKGTSVVVSLFVFFKARFNSNASREAAIDWSPVVRVPFVRPWEGGTKYFILQSSFPNIIYSSIVFLND